MPDTHGMRWSRDMTSDMHSQKFIAIIGRFNVAAKGVWTGPEFVSDAADNPSDVFDLEGLRLDRAGIAPACMIAMIEARSRSQAVITHWTINQNV